MADITLQQFYDAMAQAAREGTLSALKTLFDSGAAKISITGSNKQVVRQLIVQSDTIAAGGSELVSFNAPTGFVGYLDWIGFNIAMPTGGASGDHSVEVIYDAFDIRRIAFVVESPFGSSIRVDVNKAVIGTVDTTFLSQDQWISQVKGMPFSDTESILLRYNNNTDVDQTKSRTYEIVYLSEAVTS